MTIFRWKFRGPLILWRSEYWKFKSVTKTHILLLLSRRLKFQWISQERQNLWNRSWTVNDHFKIAREARMREWLSSSAWMPKNFFRPFLESVYLMEWEIGMGRAMYLYALLGRMFRRIDVQVVRLQVSDNLRADS